MSKTGLELSHLRCAQKYEHLYLLIWMGGFHINASQIITERFICFHQNSSAIRLRFSDNMHGESEDE